MKQNIFKLNNSDMLILMTFAFGNTPMKLMHRNLLPILKLLGNISTLSGFAMPSLESGRIGGRKLCQGKATGMPVKCTNRMFLTGEQKNLPANQAENICTMLNITDILRSLVTRTLFHFGKLKDGILRN